MPLSERSQRCLQLLKANNCSRVAFQLVYLVLSAGIVDNQSALHCVEFFAGQGAVSRALQDRGWATAQFERDGDPLTQDMLTIAGFVNAIALILRLQPGGLVWFGIVCSSWVWLSRGSTRRSIVNPSGNTARSCVRMGNVMTSRVMLLYEIASKLGHLVILEQPTSSLMHLYHHFQDLLDIVHVWRCRVCLGFFGGETEKPIFLSSCLWPYPPPCLG